MFKYNYYLAVVGAAIFCFAGCDQQKFSPEAAEKHYVSSQLLAEEGQLGQALAELTRAIDACPDMAVAHSAVGDIHRRQGHLELARRAYVISCRINPYAFRPHYRLGVTYQDLSELRDNLARSREYVSKAVSIYLRAVTLDPKDYDTNLNLSVCYFELDNLPLAEQYCRAAIECNDLDREAHVNLGIILDAQNKHYDAISVYLRALEFEGDKYYILMDLAGVYVRQKRLAAAIKYYGEAARAQPDNPRPLEKTGQCHLMLKQYLEAMEVFERVKKLDPKRAQAHHGIGAVYMSMFLKNPENTSLRDQALDAWNRSLELQPNQPDLKRLVKKYTPVPSPTGL